jgi:hypothetical protein
MNVTLPRVLFVAGMGRSGSTLLDRLVGSTDGVCSAGELRDIWSLGFVANQLCGCGSRFRECPFWREVVCRAFGGFDQVDPAALAREERFLLRWRRIPAVARGDVSGRARRALADFVRLRSALYSAIAAVSGAEVIVDSSKNPAYGVALRAITGLDVRTIHLVRDSRGVARSVSRAARDAAIEGRTVDYDYVRPAPVAAVNWIAVNAVTRLSRGDRPFRRVRYEDLAREPARIAARLLEFAGVPPSASTGSSFEPGVQHTVAGNPMRMERGPIAVRVDESWRHDLPLPNRLAVTAISWPLLLLYGYPLWPGARHGS